LDQALVARKLAPTRSQAESYIRLGKVRVNSKPVVDPAAVVSDEDRLVLLMAEQYVSRAGLKLAGAADMLAIHFDGKTVLDVGSSTGGFTDYALQHGAQKVIAVDVGTNQLHPSLLGNPSIEVHEKTDIRDFWPVVPPDLVVIDVSFVSLRAILPHIAKLAGSATRVMAMVKPQFEAPNQALHEGVIKNDRMRREILKDFEEWAQKRFLILGKADSEVPGMKGNRERFYLLQPIKKGR
jgi:23S rRNA (cytidine1920-2'-O)/16S rRNA (cytidine1409-2'-O)-methyltransferase